MLYEATKEFDLEQHFDEAKQPDVRIRLHELYQRTKNAVAKERSISLEVTLLIGLLETNNAAINLGLGKRENLARSLGLTENSYWKRAQAGRVLVAFPQFIDLVKRGLTHISHLSVLAPKITIDNADILAREIPGKTEREVRELVGSVNRDGSRTPSEYLHDIRLQFTKAQLEILDRAREVLSGTGKVPSEEEVIITSLEDLLEKRDPQRKAERADVRARKKRALGSVLPNSGQESIYPVPDFLQEDREADVEGWSLTAAPQSIALELNSNRTDKKAAPSLTPRGRKNIPAALVHEVWRRDEGCCTHNLPDGSRCLSKIGLQVDHVLPVAFGQDNRLINLRLLCRQCNISEAQRILGGKVMERYQWLQIRTTEGGRKTHPH